MSSARRDGDGDWRPMRKAAEIDGIMGDLLGMEGGRDSESRETRAFVLGLGLYEMIVMNLYS
jgi:hypothetical protein